MKLPADVLALENQLCFPLYAASRLTIKLYAPLLRELGITYPQYLVMLVVWQYREQSVSAICNRLYLETNTVTPLLKRLEEKGLVMRRRSNDDERVVHIAATEAGAKLKSRAATIPQQILHTFCDETASEADLVRLRALLNSMLSTLDQRSRPY